VVGVLYTETILRSDVYTHTHTHTHIGTVRIYNNILYFAVYDCKHVICKRRGRTMNNHGIR